MRLRRTFFHWVGRNLVSFEGPTHVVAGDLPLSLSPLDERHHRLGLGDLRRERTGCAGRHEQPLGTMETASGPAQDRAGADDRRLGMGRRRGLGPRKLHSASNGVLYSLRGCHLLGHRAASRSVTPNPRGPSHTPYATNATRRSYQPVTIMPPDPSDRRIPADLRSADGAAGVTDGTSTARPRRAVSARAARAPRAPPRGGRRAAGAWPPRPPRASPAARASTIRAWCAERGLGRPVTAGDRAAGDLEGRGDDAGEVLQHPVARDLDEQGVELGVGAGEGDRVTLGQRRGP